jgi:hypothetical protein
MLAGAGAQAALGSCLAAGMFALGIHANDHAHTVALESDGDHLDGVLSHRARDAHDPGEAARDQGLPASFSEGDHVIHIAAADVARAASRRVVLDAAPALALAGALPIATAPTRAPFRSLALRAAGVDQLRTVVLRL